MECNISMDITCWQTITMMVSIADLLSRLFANTADRENFVCTVIVVAAAVGIRYFCAVQSAKMGYLSSKAHRG